MKTYNYVRDRFREFELFREKCALSKKVESLHLKRLQHLQELSTDLEHNANQSKQSNTFQPEWERAFSAFGVVANAVEEKLSYLERLHSQPFQLRFTTMTNEKRRSEEEEEEEEELEKHSEEQDYEEKTINKCNSQEENETEEIIEQNEANDAHKRICILREEIIKLLKQLDYLVQYGVGVPDQYTTNLNVLRAKSESMKLKSNEEIVIATNVQRCLSMRLAELAYKFKKIENSYYSRCRRRQQREDAFKKFGSEEVYNLINHESKAAEYLYLGYGEEEVNTLLQERSRQEELSKEVNELVKSIDEVNTIFNDVHTFVSNQGTILDRIDYNLHISARHTKLAQNELTKAAEYQSKCCVM